MTKVFFLFAGKPKHCVRVFKTCAVPRGRGMGQEEEYISGATQQVFNGFSLLRVGCSDESFTIVSESKGGGGECLNIILSMLAIHKTIWLFDLHLSKN